MVSGLLGVPLGSFLAQHLKVHDPRADPYICAFGLMGCAPVLFAASLFSSTNTFVCYCLIFLGELMLNLNWAIVADMLLVSVVSSANTNRLVAFQCQFDVWGNHNAGRCVGSAPGCHLVDQTSTDVCPLRRLHLWSRVVRQLRSLGPCDRRSGQLPFVVDLYVDILRWTVP